MSSKDTMPLARWFRTQVQCLPWSNTDPQCRMLAGQSRKMMNPKPDPLTGDRDESLDPEKVRKAIVAVQNHVRAETSNPEFVPKGLVCINWTAPSGDSWYTHANSVPEAPPVYDTLNFREWLDEWGEQALDPSTLQTFREVFNT